MRREESVSRERVLGGVLVGGASSRMGVPKAALALRGRTLLDVAVSALGAAVQEVILLGELPDGPNRLPAATGLRSLPDAPGLGGPLAGILAALRAEPDAVWIVAACDQPWVSPAAVRWLLTQQRPGALAILPRGPDGRIEPMPALFGPGSRDLLEAAVAEGARAPRALATRSAVATPEIPERIRRAWISVNTPEEYERLHKNRPGGASAR